MNIIIIILLIVVLLVWSLIGGWKDCEAFSFIIEVKDTFAPYFAFGIHSRRYFFNGQEVGELTIGLVAINIIIEFYKNKPKE